MARSAVEVQRDRPTRPEEAKQQPLTHRLLRRLRSELDEAFDRFARHVEFPSLHPLHRIADLDRRLHHGMPLSSIAAAVDVVDEDKLFRMSVELPGIEAQDIEVSVSDNTLVIKAKKKNQREEQAQSYYLHEREYGSFERFIQMPVGIDHDKIKAEFANGVLTIELPKTPEAVRKHKKIPIQGK